MIAQAKGLLSQFTGSIKALAGSHPVATGVVLGIGAYYAINKYWLNSDAVEAEETAEKQG